MAKALMSGTFVVGSFESAIWSAAGTDLNVKKCSPNPPLPRIDIKAGLSQSQQSFQAYRPYIV
jgi:hypothetical protein